MHGCSPFFSKPISIEQLFPYKAEDVARSLTEQNINGWSYEQALQEIQRAKKDSVGVILDQFKRARGRPSLERTLSIAGRKPERP